MMMPRLAAPISGVRATVTGTMNASGLTNIDGSVAFDLAIGSYTVSFVKSGYQPVSYSFSIVNTDPVGFSFDTLPAPSGFPWALVVVIVISAGTVYVLLTD